MPGRNCAFGGEARQSGIRPVPHGVALVVQAGSGAMIEAAVGNGAFVSAKLLHAEGKGPESRAEGQKPH